MRFISAIAVLLACFFIAVSTGPRRALAQTTSATPLETQTGTITGTVRDTGGAPVAGAQVSANGPKLLVTQTDSAGNFSMSAIPGIYALTITKPGFQPAQAESLTVLSGQTNTVTVTLQAVTLTTLKTVASVISRAGQFNASPASVNVVSSQTFVAQAQPQVMEILNQTPGIVASHPAGSSNGAVPGSTTFPDIRGSFSFKTASLIDGHPISVGSFGNYVTTFLNSFVLGGVEVVKGPGAAAPETNYAIGGTVNFRTKDPTFKPTGDVILGADSYGGHIVNASYSGTLTGRKLGWALDYASYDTCGPLNNYPAFFIPNGGAILNGISVDGQDYQNSAPPNVFPGSVPFNGTSLIACCQMLQSTFNNTSELAKIQYHFSPVTVGTFSYLGSQTKADQGANISSQTIYTFAPGLAAGAPPPSPPVPYAGSLAPGAQTVTNLFPGQTTEYNNEPIFQGEVRTSIGKDTLIVRGYTATINRLNFQGGDNPSIPITENVALYGTAYDPDTGAPLQTFNGQSEPVQFFAYFHQFELDRLAGYSAEYDHAMGDNIISLAYDHTHSSTYSGTYESDAFDPLGWALVYNVPNGSAQDFGTFLLRGLINAGPKLHLTVSNYYNTYRSTYPVDCGGGCPKFFGSTPVDFIFQTTTRTHYDGRLGIDYRLNPNVALRFSLGSAIAPPYLFILSRIPRGTSFSFSGHYGSQTLNAGNLAPETAFGYDLGGDFRTSSGIDTLSFDLYITNLFNQFIQQTFLIGRCNQAGSSCTPDPSGTYPLYGQQYVNLTNARYEGLEFALRRTPAAGLGFTIQGAMQKAYPYNLSPCFYFSTGCTGTPNTNLAVLPNQNFYGGVEGTNGVSNQNIPYAQAYGQLSYRFPSGFSIEAGDTLYGHNNSYDEPAFWVADGSLRMPLGSGTSFQVSVYNMFNAYPAIFPVLGAGVPAPLANGQIGLTMANVIGPRRITLMFEKSFGNP